VKPAVNDRGRPEDRDDVHQIAPDHGPLAPSARLGLREPAIPVGLAGWLLVDRE
jgi:hypothetical protein